jgi:hypothetical protein
MSDCCEYYQEGLDELNRFILHEQARNPANRFMGKPFEYCPWCGKCENRTPNKKPVDQDG